MNIHRCNVGKCIVTLCQQYYVLCYAGACDVITHSDAMITIWLRSNILCFASRQASAGIGITAHRNKSSRVLARNALFPRVVEVSLPNFRSTPELGRPRLVSFDAAPVRSRQTTLQRCIGNRSLVRKAESTAK
ncbi:hypothetical protein LSAT2_003356 [Lamellibrachia satsuma]|nr:hypothetical protein LSAT2_003356 [Lamellibrachia satsuma]